MKLSNLRIERQTDGWSRLVVDVATNWTKNNQLWLATPTEYESYLTDDVYDSFLVAAIWPAMFYNEDIEVEGEVSPRLLFNMKNYVQYAIKAYRPNMQHMVNIKVKGTKIAKQVAKHVAAGFSGGIDAFTTVIDRLENETDPERRIDTFTFFNVGSHGEGEKRQEKSSTIAMIY